MDGLFQKLIFIVVFDGLIKKDLLERMPIYEMNI